MLTQWETLKTVFVKLAKDYPIPDHIHLSEEEILSEKLN